MYDLYEELKRKLDLLDIAIKELRKRGSDYAQAERDYRVELAKAILGCREQGMPATITPDVCRGRKDIANLRFDRDCKEVAYKAAMEAINGYKLQIRILDAQIQREWGQAGMN